MYSHQLIRITAATLTAFALVVFAAPAPARQTHGVRTSSLAGTADPAQDLRSPDTRDAALISQGLLPQQPTSTISIDRTPGTATVQTPATQFDWAAAAIGAAGTLGMVLLATGAAIGTRRRRQPDQPVTIS
jgi:hypothetical protein